jgi:Na+-translocating ferredoxin:NAD+ oxidoreductase RnfC subunit
MVEKERFIDLVKSAGIVGEGGAGFPAHVKYDAAVDTVIANGCECEPLLFTDQYHMMHHAPDIVRALCTLVAVTGARRGVIALKRKHAAIVEHLSQAIAGTGLTLSLLDNFYPAGDEQVLVKEVAGRTVPPLGLPLNVGVVVANVGSLVSVSRAMDGVPVTRKVVTVTARWPRPGWWKPRSARPYRPCRGLRRRAGLRPGLRARRAHDGPRRGCARAFAAAVVTRPPAGSSSCRAAISCT